MINVAAGMMIGLPTTIHDAVGTARPAEEATRKTKAAAAEGGYTAVSAPASSCEELHPYHPWAACDLESPPLVLEAGTGAEIFSRPAPIVTIWDTALHGRDPKPDKREHIKSQSADDAHKPIVRFSSKSRLIDMSLDCPSRPPRPAPYHMEHEHEIHPYGKELVDLKTELVHTKVTEMVPWVDGLRLQQIFRNQCMKDKLKSGVSVVYKSSGCSLWPHANKGDMVMFEPVLHP